MRWSVLMLYLNSCLPRFTYCEVCPRWREASLGRALGYARIHDAPGTGSLSYEAWRLYMPPNCCSSTPPPVEFSFQGLLASFLSLCVRGHGSAVLLLFRQFGPVWHIWFAFWILIRPHVLPGTIWIDLMIGIFVRIYVLDAYSDSGIASW
jgi:hypothetical protein